MPALLAGFWPYFPARRTSVTLVGAADAGNAGTVFSA